MGGLRSTGTLLTYNFTYDAFGRTTSVKVMGKTLASYTYQQNTGLMLSTTYGNGFTVAYSYDDLGRVTTVKYNGSTAYTYEYDGSGNLILFKDYLNSVNYVYDYNSSGSILAEEQYTFSGEFKEGEYYKYNGYGDVSSSAIIVPGVGTTRYVVEYGYNENNYVGNQQSVTKWKVKGTDYWTYNNYDDLNRLSEQVMVYDYVGENVQGYTRSYSYYLPSGGTSTLIGSLSYDGNLSSHSYRYTYDKRGNLTSVAKGTNTIIRYEYDDLGQLIRENNDEVKKTWVYSYDERGNIISRRTYNHTLVATDSLETLTPTSVDTYTYFDQWDEAMWNDGLKSYNGSAAFTYDSIGNPLTYNNGSAYTFTWQNGRELASGTKGSTSFAYTYNADGLRTQKVVGNLVYTYYWQGGQLAAMTIGNTSGNISSTLKFYYDSNGIPFILDYNGTIYFYVTNLHGDVIGLATSEGMCGYYRYDAWGQIVTMDAASTPYYNALNANPLRYRGYVYDNETGFYYLQSRYYDPAVRRFINADSPEMALEAGITDKNLYAYCDNNPIMRSDEDGEFWNVVIGAAVGAIVGGVTAWASGGDWKSIAISVGVGLLSGGLAATGIHAVGQLAIGGATNALSNVLDQIIVKGKGITDIDWESVAYDAVIGLASSAISYGATKSAADYADNLISKGINKIIKGRDLYIATGRYGKGAIKKGLDIMRVGLKRMDIVYGYSSVLGSLVTGIATTTRQLFMIGV